MIDREKLIALMHKGRQMRHDICYSYTDCDLCPYNADGDDCGNGIIADHLIANGVTIQQWVSVAERLPEIGVNILVCHKNGYVTRNAWLGTRWLFKNKTNPVTHWMLMPQPLKEVE